MKDNLTDFGFERVTFPEKTAKVKQLFSNVANHYDMMNDIMSFGLHRCWKKAFIHRLPLAFNQNILDVAGGTGDIAMHLKKSYAHLGLNITVCDLTLEMVQRGRDRAINQGIVNTLDWCCGNAEQLPLPDSSFDLYTVAFGMRNVSDRPKALAEAWRVLKPGGWFFCLEFSQVDNVLFKKAYDLYSFQILPRVGGWVAKNQDAYRYLAESIRQFPNQRQWQADIHHAGFKQVFYEDWMGGMVALHWACKTER